MKNGKCDYNYHDHNHHDHKPPALSWLLLIIIIERWVAEAGPYLTVKIVRGYYGKQVFLLRFRICSVTKYYP